MKAITILIIALVAVVGVFSAPDEGMPLAEWTASFLFTKAVGVGAAMLAVRLYDRWYGRFNGKGGEA
jgi:di/tricarboxylate transporter